MALFDAARDLAEHRVGGTAARGAADERDHAEVAREAAAVLHLDERAHAVEPRVGLHTADRADVAGNEGRGLLAALRHHDDVLRQSRERVCREVRGATGDIDASVRPRGARGLFSGLRDGLMGDAARVDDRDVGGVVTLRVAVGEQPLAHLVRIDVRDLAAQEPDRERRHVPEP